MNPPSVSQSRKIPEKANLGLDSHHISLIIQMNPTCQNTLAGIILQTLYNIPKFSGILRRKILVCIQKGDPLIHGFADGKVLGSGKIIDPLKLVNFGPHLPCNLHCPVVRASIHYDLLRYNALTPG